MKRTVKTLAVTTLAAIVYSPAALAATNYPAIQPKHKAGSDAGQGVFAWIVNNFPWVLVGIAVFCFICAGIGSARRNKQYQVRVERLRELEAQHAREKKQEDMESFRHQMFMRQQRALMSDSLRYDILKRDGYRCRICGATQADGVKLHVDHIIPVSKGGRTEPSNLQTLCERCNLGKSNKL